MMINMEVGNYRGELYIKNDDGKYYWAVECDMDHVDVWDWKEIPKSLYDEMVKFSNTVSV